MKRFVIISFIIIVSLLKVNASELHSSVYIPKLDTIIGFFDFEQLTESPYNEWYEPEYENYVLDIETLDQINRDFLPDIEIYVVIGTWCSDSQRETPRFAKIVEYLELRNITCIGVNRAKKAPHTSLEKLDIQFVPTFIFYFEGKEIGRIIEFPDESLEKDILKIISNL